MPIIEFSQKDILRGTVVIPAWYRVRIDGVGEKLSSKGDSTNYVMEGTIIKNADNGDEKFSGVPLDWNFNSKAIGFMVGYFTALGVEVKPGERFELESTSGKEIDIFVENGEYDGRIVNRVNHKYRPAKEA